MTTLSCKAEKCIHHDGEGCMLDEVELEPVPAHDDGWMPETLKRSPRLRAVCGDYAEGS